ncbi:glycerophosphodiester phosphodiesterase [Intrasporangium sp. DVR]|uniref:glycerophosphodiester phosphodiesterase n=1 Tax=Intrasporangium sp. DVR TaxID=3127867 RepID=UPI00313A602B
MTSRPYLAATPVALAHRGGALYEPNLGFENTMTAFRHAVELGYTHIETDVHATRDGRLVAFHDDHLDRVSDMQGRIRTLDWEKVRWARVGHGEHIPLLAEVVDTFPGIKLNIDLKAPRTAELLWELIEQRGLHDSVCVGSFYQREISTFRKVSAGRVATAASHVGTVLMRFGPRALSRVLRTPADVFQVPPTHVVAGREVTVVTRSLVEAAHHFGKQVHAWTVDDAAEMHRLLDLGVDGLVSDRIDVLKDVLTERNLWTGVS